MSLCIGYIHYEKAFDSIEDEAIFKALRTIGIVETKGTNGVKSRTKQEVFGKYKEIFVDRHLPMSLKRKAFKQCALLEMTCGSQLWSLTKALVKKLETSQRAMERKIH